MTSTESYRRSHLGKGRDYHDTFAAIPHRAMLWRLEQRVLADVLERSFPAEAPEYLDFACGTGRVLSHVGRRARKATGIDVSHSMLEVAAEAAPFAELIQGDLTRSDVLNGRKFDLITAFRFFPNAEPELRREVMMALARHLRPGGYLLFNNHKNASSLTRRIASFVRRIPREDGRSIDRLMSHEEVTSLVEAANLQIKEIHPLGCLPLTERHMVLPVAIAEAAERALSRLSATRKIAQDVLYLCAPR